MIKSGKMLFSLAGNFSSRNWLKVEWNENALRPVCGHKNLLSLKRIMVSIMTSLLAIFLIKKDFNRRFVSVKKNEKNL